MLLVLAAAGCSGGGEHVTSPRPSGSGTTPSQVISPAGFSDCNRIRPGDKMEFATLQCDPEQTPQNIMECKAGTYVHLTRPVYGDLEGIVGLTPVWQRAQPISPRYGRTVWAFEHCKEED